MVTIWHNPKCATSRKVLASIRAKGVEPTVVEYLKTPPSAAEIKTVLKEMGIRPRELLRGAALPTMIWTLPSQNGPMPNWSLRWPSILS